MSGTGLPRILVAGRAGQLATDLVERATASARPLVALGRPDLDLADLNSIEQAIATHRPDIVINAAAYTNVDKAESEPALARALNVEGPARLAVACKAAQIPLIHVSTDMVFGDDRERPHREDDATNPLSAYARSKLEGEYRVAETLDDHAIVRVSWVFGPSGDNFVKKLLIWAQARPQLSIVSDQRGRPTHSPALAAALLVTADRMLAGSSAARPRGILHVAGASVMTRVEQARQVMAASAARGGPVAAITPVLTRDFPTPAIRALNAVLDVSRAEALGLALGPFGDDLAATLDRVIGPVRN